VVDRRIATVFKVLAIDLCVRERFERITVGWNGLESDTVLVRQLLPWKAFVGIVWPLEIAYPNAGTHPSVSERVRDAG